MTSTKQERSAPKPATIADAVRLAAADAAARAELITWPSAEYRNDPARFCRDILGLALTSQQIEVAEGVRDHQFTTVRAGQKRGKSEVAAALALHHWCTHDEARVLLTAASYKQVEDVLYYAVRRLYARAARRGFPLGGKLGDLPRTGLKSDDFRELVGFSASEADTAAGYSGGDSLLIIVDEASGVDDRIYEALQGNTAGGGRLLLIGNPLRDYGFFFHTHARSDNWHRIHMKHDPSIRVPGIVTEEWIERMRRDHDENSAFWKARVLGEFPEGESGRVMQFATIEAAIARWENGEVAAGDDDTLQIGIDPAFSMSKRSDLTAFAVRRGSRIEAIVARQGLSFDAIEAFLLGLLKEHKRAGEPAKPIVIVDAEGPDGERLFRRLKALGPAHGFIVGGVKGHDLGGDHYARMSDRLVAELGRWLMAGGAIPRDAKLERELNAYEWTQVDGKQRVTPKDDLRIVLGRSPDRADAVALACFPPSLALRSASRAQEKPAWNSLDHNSRLNSGGTAHHDAATTYQWPDDPYAGR